MTIEYEYRNVPHSFDWYGVTNASWLDARMWGQVANCIQDRRSVMELSPAPLYLIGTTGDETALAQLDERFRGQALLTLAVLFQNFHSVLSNLLNSQWVDDGLTWRWVDASALLSDLSSYNAFLQVAEHGIGCLLEVLLFYRDILDRMDQLVAEVIDSVPNHPPGYLYLDVTSRYEVDWIRVRNDGLLAYSGGGTQVEVKFGSQNLWQGFDPGGEFASGTYDSETDTGKPFLSFNLRDIVQMHLTADGDGEQEWISLGRSYNSLDDPGRASVLLRSVDNLAPPFAQCFPDATWGWFISQARRYYYQIARPPWAVAEAIPINLTLPTFSLHPAPGFRNVVFSLSYTQNQSITLPTVGEPAESAPAVLTPESIVDFPLGSRSCYIAGAGNIYALEAVLWAEQITHDNIVSGPDGVGSAVSANMVYYDPVAGGLKNYVP